MGKQWKKKERPQPEVTSGYKWSSQSYTLKQILKNFKMPVVIQCSEETNAEHLQNFFFDLRQPVLLHSKRTSRKVFARCVRKGPGGTIKELLPEVVIPEDYAGWFKISKGLEFSKPSPHKTIDSITRTNTEFFLCTTEFDAIVVTDVHRDVDEGNGSFSRPVVEGEVLRKLGVQKLNQLMLPESQLSLDRDNRYLLCMDENDSELFVPVSQSGLFYEVSDGNLNKNDNSVIQISDILDEMVEMPLYVRHILGDPPPISKFYSPCLKLVRVKEEETIMGSTLDAEEDALPLELQTHSPIKFEIALNTPMLQSCAEYTEAVDMCNNVAQNYVTDMKLAVTFRVPPSSDDENNAEESLAQPNPSFVGDESESQMSVSNSQRTSTSVGRGSELGEVEANSEFSIKWDPDTKVTRQSPKDLIDLPEPDCVSIDSVDSEHAMKLNTMLGGQYFDTDLLTQQKIDNTLIQDSRSFDEILNQRRYSNSDINETLNARKSSNLVSDLPFSSELTPFVNIVEEVTDFSVNSGLAFEDSGSGPSTSTAILRPPSPFSDNLNSMPSSVTASSSKMHSSSSTIDSCRSQVDLSDHFPSIHSSATSLSVDSNGILKPAYCSFAFSRDVYVSPDITSSHDSVDKTFSSNESIDGSWQKWNQNRFRVVRSRDMPRNNIQNTDGRTINHDNVFKTRSLSQDLIEFEEPSRPSSSSSILTCKVADEMVSSCNDLRLSLEEITRNARQNHSESSWRQFCLERSSSLPVRSKIATGKQMSQTDDHSQSWEQISPRRSESNTNENTPRDNRFVKTVRTLNKLDGDFSDSFGDKTHLISDTSSEESIQYSHRSLDSIENEANTSFALSETSDMSVTDGQESILAAIAEMDSYLDGLSASSKSSIRSDIAQKIKINQEIKRKQLGEWNDIVEVI